MDGFRLLGAAARARRRDALAFDARGFCRSRQFLALTEGEQREAEKRRKTLDEREGEKIAGASRRGIERENGNQRRACKHRNGDPMSSINRLASRPDLTNDAVIRSEEHTSELQSLMRISYAVFCLTKKKR